MDKTLRLPSNRSFGWTFSGMFLIVGVYGLWRGGTRYLAPDSAP
jgi:hypothetical protein